MLAMRRQGSACREDRGDAGLDNVAAGEIKDRDTTIWRCSYWLWPRAGHGWRGKAVRKVRSFEVEQDPVGVFARIRETGFGSVSVECEGSGFAISDSLDYP